MKRFGIFVFLFFLSFSINSLLFSIDNEDSDNDFSIPTYDNSTDKSFDELEFSEIFADYIEIMNRYTDSSLFLKGWRIIEYLQFLDALIDTHKIVKKYSEKNQVFVSNGNKNFPIIIRDISTTNTIVMGISSRFSEILGALHLISHDNTSYLSSYNMVFVPEQILDPNEFLDEFFGRQKNPRRHDGVLIRIEGDNVYIYNVFESKFSGNVDIKQIKGVFKRWKKDGIVISRRVFKPENIFLLSSNNKPIPIQKSSDKDFERLLYITGLDLRVDDSNFKKKYPFLSLYNISVPNVINKNIIKNISIDILASLYSSNSSQRLDNAIHNLIRKVLIKLRNYIKQYNTIPSFDPKFQNITFYTKNSGTHSRNTDTDIESIKDLTVSLYYICHSSILHAIFSEELPNFFTIEEIERLYVLLKKDSFMSLSNFFDIEEIIDSIVEILGENHRKYIESVAYQNQVFLKTVYKTFAKEFSKKFSFLTSEFMQTFNVTDIKRLMLNNLEIFITMKYSKLKEILNYLNINLKFLQQDDVKYKFLNLYLKKLIDIKYFDENITNIHKFITERFMKNNSVAALEFMFKNFRSLNALSFKNFKNNYNYLSKFFATMSEDSIHNLFLDNINTLLYLNENNFKGLVDYLSKTFNFSDIQVQEIIIKNFSNLYRFNLSTTIENINFVTQYLTNIGYEVSPYEFLRDKLYRISYIDIDKAQEVLEFMYTFLGEPYKASLYKWLLEGTESFEGLELSEINDSISFLIENLKDENLVKKIVSSLNNFSYLNKKLWCLIVNRMNSKLKNQKETINLLFEKGFLDFNIVFNSLDAEQNDMSNLYVLDAWINAVLTKYYKNQICTMLYMKKF